MSIGVSGILYADKNDILYTTEASLYFEMIANKYRIGSKLGGNVTEEIYNRYAKNDEKYLFIFELMDSPLDNYAEELFEANMYGQDDSDNLQSRMQRVENMFKEIMNYKHVTQITLDINYIFGFSQKKLVINVSEFAQTMAGLYIENNVLVPTVRVVLKNSRR